VNAGAVGNEHTNFLGSQIWFHGSLLQNFPTSDRD
jgi:hypothetical protein